MNGLTDRCPERLYVIGVRQGPFQTDRLTLQGSGQISRFGCVANQKAVAAAALRERRLTAARADVEALVDIAACVLVGRAAVGLLVDDGPGRGGGASP